MGTLLKTSRLQGEPVQNVELFQRAWAECVELRSQSKDRWIGSTLTSLASFTERWEIFYVQNSRPVGGVVLAFDFDCHVGECMSVFAQYVLPEFRNQGASPAMMRECIRIAKSQGVGVLAYTHRKGPWRYETAYIPLRRTQ